MLKDLPGPHGQLTAPRLHYLNVITANNVELTLQGKMAKLTRGDLLKSSQPFSARIMLPFSPVSVELDETATFKWLGVQWILQHHIGMRLLLTSSLPILKR